ncbi:phosphopantothenoylcysteine decarboxylase [Canna indica]|uniref:phosphopantothenoylcysteine decarboxylase n=1 Tax=Canna indica TaxID=4628 RepID=A0AAQ3KTV3_9LILI|nr:phosphopantothenoylcysteine decarboxylase [Canna indica]
MAQGARRRGDQSNRERLGNDAHPEISRSREGLAGERSQSAVENKTASERTDLVAYGSSREFPGERRYHRQVANMKEKAPLLGRTSKIATADRTRFSPCYVCPSWRFPSVFPSLALTDQLDIIVLIQLLTQSSVHYVRDCFRWPFSNRRITIQSPRSGAWEGHTTTRKRRVWVPITKTKSRIRFTLHPNHPDPPCCSPLPLVPNRRRIRRKRLGQLDSSVPTSRSPQALPSGSELFLVWLCLMANAQPKSDNMNCDNIHPVKPKILLAVSGSVAAIKFEILCRSFLEWAEVRAVATKSSLHFIDKASLPRDVILYTDEDEWSSWKKIGDEVLHIELRKWADIMVIAPLSANTLAKIAGGLCDNLLTCIVRAWDFSKPIYVAPAMNTFMWNNPFTKRHLDGISELGVHLIPPIAKRLACGDYGNGAMAEPSVVYTTVRLSYKPPVNGSS